MERRLAAILAADVVGYSRLMGEDEAGTLTRLSRLRKERIEPLIAEHRGRVVKLMQSALMSFPVMPSLDDDPKNTASSAPLLSGTPPSSACFRDF